jgi:hypothetical protein
MAAYSRQSTFTDGDTISASLFNNEYDALAAAFVNTSGHKHDGTTGEGPVIGVLGDAGVATPLNKILIDSSNDHIEFYVDVSSSAVQQAFIADGVIAPVTDSDVDLGTSSLYFKNAFIDAITTTGNVAVGGNLTVTGNTTFNGGTQTLGDAATDNVVFGADVNSSIIPNTDNSFDLGSSSQEWKDIYIDGVAYLDEINFNGTAISATAAELNKLDGVTASTAELNILDGVTASTADINLIDGITNGTVIASKAIITDSNKDITGGRNITISGELDAATLDISGNTDIDGDIDVDGTSNLDNTDIDGTLVVDGSNISLDSTSTLNIDNSNTSNGITIGTATSGVPISIGHTTSEVTVNDNLTVTGDLTVSGTTTTVNSTTVNLNDHNIVLDTGNSTSAVINGAGITIEGGSGDDATFTYNTTGPKFELKLGSSHEDLQIAKLIGTELDISGDADIDGTLEADAITVNGTALSSVIAGTTVNLASSATALATGRTIGMTGDVVWTSASFDGSGNVTGSSTIQSNAVETAMVNANVISGQTAITSGIDSSADVLLLHDDSASALKKVSIASIFSSVGGLSDVVADTSPELGGDLNVNGNDIVSASNANISLLPNGSGKVLLDGNGSTGGVAVTDGNIDIRSSTGVVSKVKFYCEVNNAHAQTLQAQPHSAGSSAVLVLPVASGTLVGTGDTGSVSNTMLAGSIADSKLATISTADKVSAAAIQVDGATDGTSITIADSDKLIVDDNGTTKYVNASQLNTYIDAAIDVVNDTSPQLGGNLDVNTKNIVFGDSGGAFDDRLSFGASDDLQIYHDGNHSFIDDNGTGNLKITSNGGGIDLTAGGEDMAKFVPNGAVELYHDNSKKIETTAAGATVSGVVTATGFTIGSAAITETELEILDGASVTTTELNILDGVTASTSELNTMDGITASTAELNHTDGVTSNIQTQLNAKASAGFAVAMAIAL